MCASGNWSVDSRVCDNELYVGYRSSVPSLRENMGEYHWLL